MSGKYILDNHTPVPCEDVMQWATWFESADRSVAKTDIGEARVSTVFLGIDHRFGDEGAPLLFETAIFPDRIHEYCERCATWELAEAQHAVAVAVATLRTAAAVIASGLAAMKKDEAP